MEERNDCPIFTTYIVLLLLVNTKQYPPLTHCSLPFMRWHLKDPEKNSLFNLYNLHLLEIFQFDNEARVIRKTDKDRERQRKIKKDRERQRKAEKERERQRKTEKDRERQRKMIEN